MVCFVGIILIGVLISGCSTSVYQNNLNIDQEITNGNSKISIVDFETVNFNNNDLGQLFVYLKMTNWQKPNVTIPLTNVPEGYFSNQGQSWSYETFKLDDGRTQYTFDGLGYDKISENIVLAYSGIDLTKEYTLVVTFDNGEIMQYKLKK